MTNEELTTAELVLAYQLLKDQGLELDDGAKEDAIPQSEWVTPVFVKIKEKRT
jgi:hypothetical protein